MGPPGSSDPRRDRLDHGIVDVLASLEARVPPPELFAWVGDLSRYPSWLEMVPRAEEVEAAAGDAGPAWSVDLRGRLGPLARSKRLRMVRTEHLPPHRVVFERRERDGRQHSPWVLTAEVASTPDGSRLEMRLHYGGRFASRALRILLAQEIERSRLRLLELLGQRPTA